MHQTQHFGGIEIAGTGAYIPSAVVTNKMFEEIVETSDEWITTRTGIKERRFTSGEPNWYMSVMAARQAIDTAKIKGKDVDLIIHTSVTPDFNFPSMSCMVQNQIEAQGCMTVDVNCACAGFVYAIDMARRYLYTDGVDTVLIVSADILSNITDFSDRASCILFGDGAGAAVVKRSDSGKMFRSYLGSDGRGAHFMYTKHNYPIHPFAADDNVDKSAKKYADVLDDMVGDGIKMDGKEVYKFATKAMADCVNNVCKQAGISAGDVDLFVPHQANIRIIKTAASYIGVPAEKMYCNIDRFGNTSSASIPICLRELYEQGKIQSGMKICIVGFGAGLTYGAVLMEV